MSLSVLDLFTIGIGPSSSHTVGLMRAGQRFAGRLRDLGLLPATHRVEAHLYGSLALTGKGHGSDSAVLLGLEGELPETVEVDQVPARLHQIRQSQQLNLGGERQVAFHEKEDLQFHRMESLPAHPNGLSFVARDSAGGELLRLTYYSIGGGFVVNEGTAQRDELSTGQRVLPYPYRSGQDLMEMSRQSGLSVSSLTLANEATWRPEAGTRAALLKVWHAMKTCVERGCREGGTLPGGLKVPRRAPGIYQDLSSHPEQGLQDPLTTLDWVSLWAMAVNEENAAGGRVVTAPTNGAAGILPAALHYLVKVQRVTDEDKLVRFLMTAGAIGILYKLNASISGAEVGCQGVVIATMRQTGADMSTKYKETSRGGLAVNVTEC